MWTSSAVNSTISRLEKISSTKYRVMGGMEDRSGGQNGAMWGGVRTIAPFHQSMEIGDPEEAALAVGEAVCAADA